MKACLQPVQAVHGHDSITHSLLHYSMMMDGRAGVTREGCHSGCEKGLGSACAFIQQQGRLGPWGRTEQAVGKWVGHRAEL